MFAGLEPWHFACTACGLERSTLSPRINEVESIDEIAREAALKPIRDQNFRTLVQWLNGRVGSRAGGAKLKLLDVGCAHGWFVEAAAVDYDVLGLEPDARIAQGAQRRNLPVRKGYFPGALDAAEQFDVIVFNDVLEHIPEVKNVLSACAARLRPQGVVVVNAPDRRGLFYRLSKLLAKARRPAAFHRMWQVGLPSPHLYYFDTASMNRIAEASGFRVAAERPLPSIVAKGLYSRVHYAGTPSRLRSAVTAAGILALIPFLKLFPSDITVWALEKRTA
jgi:SAM-dependent methyltransferase